MRVSLLVPLRVLHALRLQLLLCCVQFGAALHCSHLLKLRSNTTPVGYFFSETRFFKKLLTFRTFSCQAAMFVNHTAPNFCSFGFNSSIGAPVTVTHFRFSCLHLLCWLSGSCCNPQSHGYFVAFLRWLWWQPARHSVVSWPCPTRAVLNQNPSVFTPPHHTLARLSVFSRHVFLTLLFTHACHKTGPIGPPLDSTHVSLLSALFEADRVLSPPLCSRRSGPSRCRSSVLHCSTGLLCSM